MMIRMAMLLLAMGIVWASGVVGAEPQLVLENPQVALQFAADTGAWIGVIDKQSGENLVVSSPQLSTVSPAPPPTLDHERIAAAVAAGQALDLSGDWTYAPAVSQTELPAAFANGDFSGVSWQPTLVPSRRGSGDDRLHGQVGDFWYRREFTAAGLAPIEAMALVVAQWMTSMKCGSTDNELAGQVTKRRMLGGLHDCTNFLPSGCDAINPTCC